MADDGAGVEGSRFQMRLHIYYDLRSIAYGFSDRVTVVALDGAVVEVELW
jgi:hypothetical protein